MPAIAFPRSQLVSLQELAAKVIEARGPAADIEALADDLLSGFSDACARAGLDGVLVELEQAIAPLDDPRHREELLGRLGNKAEFDPRGPRNAKPKQLADCLIAALSLAPSDPPDRSIQMTDELRGEVTKALASVLDVELEASKLRATIIAKARGATDERHSKAFDKISGQLDERGMRAPQPQKIALDAVHAVQRALADARTAVVAQTASDAIDRAKAALARVSPEAAERIDQPITHRLTPRQVAIQRVHDVRVHKTPAAIAVSLFESLSELSQLAWSRREQAARAYAPTQTYVVGELIDHPKFGRGTVKAVAIQRIDVEFPEGPNTLVHARPGK